MAAGDVDVLAELRALRRDWREDIGHLRDDVREDVMRVEDRLMGMMQAFAKAHAAEHDEDRLVLERDLGDLKAWKHTSEISSAKKEGALGVFRYTLELLSRYAKPIVAVIVALAGGALVLAGKVDISVGIR